MRVTAHPYSQRAAIARGYRETAHARIGLARMTMEGIEGAEVKRTASLLTTTASAVTSPGRAAVAVRRPPSSRARDADLLVADPPEVLYDERPVAVYEESSRATAVIRISAWDEREVTHSLRHVSRHMSTSSTPTSTSSGAATDAAIEHRTAKVSSTLVSFSSAAMDATSCGSSCSRGEHRAERTVCDSDVAQGMPEPRWTIGAASTDRCAPLRGPPRRGESTRRRGRS